MKRRSWICILAVLLVLAGVWAFGKDALSGSVNGTYLWGTGPEQRSISLDESQQTFYYADQSRGLYLKGTLEAQENGSYVLSCGKMENRAVIAPQRIYCQNKEFTLVVEGTALTFRKWSDRVTILGSEERYT